MPSSVNATDIHVNFPWFHLKVDFQTRIEVCPFNGFTGRPAPLDVSVAQAHNMLATVVAAGARLRDAPRSRSYSSVRCTLGAARPLRALSTRPYTIITSGCLATQNASGVETLASSNEFAEEVSGGDGGSVDSGNKGDGAGNGGSGDEGSGEGDAFGEEENPGFNSVVTFWSLCIGLTASSSVIKVAGALPDSRAAISQKTLNSAPLPSICDHHPQVLGRCHWQRHRWFWAPLLVWRSRPFHLLCWLSRPLP